MKIILLILIFGIISSTTLPVIPIWYNYDYELMKDFSSSYTQYFFKARVISYDDMDIELNMTQTDYSENYFSVLVMDYEIEPTYDDIYYMKHYNYRTVLPSHDYDQGGYKIMAFTYRAYYNYLGIVVSYQASSFHQFSYLYFRVDVTKYKYSNIKELNYNEKYSFYTQIFNGQIIPRNYQIYIRIKVISDDNMEIQLTTDQSNDPNTDFKVDVCQYKEIPNESQVYYGIGAEKCDNGLPNSSEEKNYYAYKFSTELKVQYLSISIINQITDESKYLYLKKLDIYIYSETGMKIAVLVTIIVVPILVVGAIIYVVLRKLGYCQK